jgi:predicted CXXCH cytochrome family protein
LKKILIIAAAALLLALGAVAVVSADNGPHGGYNLSTDKCAGCHRPHTAQGPMLLHADNVAELCYTCHGAGKTLTDPFNGQLMTPAADPTQPNVGTGQTLNGGGFIKLGGSVDASSQHGVEGLHLGGTELTGEGTAWGGTTAGAGINGVLECTSCHNPHGSTNYRILNDSGEWGDGTTDPVTNLVNESLAFKKNQVLPTADDNFNYAAGTHANYTGGMRDFCVTCHKTYLTRTGAYSRPSTTDAVRSDGSPYFYYPGTQSVPNGTAEENQDIARYRHTTSRQYTGCAAGDDVYAAGSKERTSGLLCADAFGTTDPLLRFAATSTDANPANRSEFTCTSCHFAHGSSAQATGFAANVAPTNDSANLYLDNRGVCRRCHAPGTSNFNP